ncbi:MAG: hypothetical protein QXK34_00940 [Candidatus Bathyarchaeia archaeon]
MLLVRLKHDGTVRIERAMGKRATVYVPIPGGNHGAGKVQIRLQKRIMEFLAVTAWQQPLPTGTQVEVVDVVNHNTLEVRPVGQVVVADVPGASAASASAADPAGPTGVADVTNT